MTESLEVVQLKLRTEMLRTLRRDRLKVIDDLCGVLECHEHELVNKATDLRKCVDPLLSTFNCIDKELPEETKKMASRINSLCELLCCSRDELRGKVEVLKEEGDKLKQELADLKLSEESNIRLKELEDENARLKSLATENARLRGELTTWENDSEQADEIVAGLREQVRVLKEAMEDEEVLA